MLCMQMITVWLDIMGRTAHCWPSEIRCEERQREAEMELTLQAPELRVLQKYEPVGSFPSTLSAWLKAQTENHMLNTETV